MPKEKSPTWNLVRLMSPTSGDPFHHMIAHAVATGIAADGLLLEFKEMNIMSTCVYTPAIMNGQNRGREVKLRTSATM